MHAPAGEAPHHCSKGFNYDRINVRWGTLDSRDFVVLVVHVINYEENWVINDLRTKAWLVIFIGGQIDLAHGTCCSEDPKQANHVIPEIVKIPPGDERRLLIVHLWNFIVAADPERVHSFNVA
jgi:hypothetical protein